MGPREALSDLASMMSQSNSTVNLPSGIPSLDVTGMSEDVIRAEIQRLGGSDGVCPTCGQGRKAVNAHDRSTHFSGTIFICACTPTSGQKEEEEADKPTATQIVEMSGLDRAAIETSQFRLHDGNRAAVKGLFPPDGDTGMSPANAPCAWITGGPRVGKTRLAYELIKQYAMYGRFSWYLNTDLLMTILPGKDNKDGELALRRLQDRVERVDLLILDGLGRRNFGWAEADQLFRLLSARTACSGRTIFFSRLEPSQTMGQLQPTKTYPPLMDIIQKNLSGNGRLEPVFYGIDGPPPAVS